MFWGWRMPVEWAMGLPTPQSISWAQLDVTFINQKWLPAMLERWWGGLWSELQPWHGLSVSNSGIVLALCGFQHLWILVSMEWWWSWNGLPWILRPTVLHYFGCLVFYPSNGNCGRFPWGDRWLVSVVSPCLCKRGITGLTPEALPALVWFTSVAK